ncbi:right-handed parallel beta-helix repeat-containing protein [Leptolyngbya sp. O-77]|uniref:right-handed parallel beta-helix repeat-containing protein n=1 Tax=Leptolyngbya sp. O-77 TaxID=1080068 RepID=UPI00155FFB78|nr:right-handed parallel beta-helix repeat-containing protein [Leptolyngbya sp. O-77]
MCLRGGTYFLSQPLRLTGNESGTAERPVLISSAPGETARLVAGQPIPASAWTAIANPAERARLPEAARDRVLQADLKSLGITDYGQIQRRGTYTEPDTSQLHLELFQDGEALTLARYPNRHPREGWIQVQGFPEGLKGKKFQIKGDRLERWNVDDAWVYGSWSNTWSDDTIKVASIDANEKTITLTEAPLPFGFSEDEGEPFGRFFVFNLLEELDQPGEWYLNRATGILYVYPKPSPQPPEFIISMLENAVVFEPGAHHISLQNVVIEASRGTAVRLEGHHLSLRGCVVRNAGGKGVVTTGENITLLSNDIYHTAAGGIMLDGNREKGKLYQPSHNLAQNNRIHDVNRWERYYRPAVDLEASGGQLIHNLIYNHPHMAVAFGGSDHQMAWNEIHHVVIETEDAGAFYRGRSWVNRGHAIRNNYIHHIGRYFNPVQAAEDADTGIVYGPFTQDEFGDIGIYFDDRDAGTTVVGNVIHGGTVGVWVGGGHDQKIIGNILIKATRAALRIDTRGLINTYCTLENYQTPDCNDELYRKTMEHNPLQPPLATKYPELAKKLRENRDMRSPLDNQAVHNLAVNTENIDFRLIPSQQSLVDENNDFKQQNNPQISIEIDSDDPRAIVSAIPRELLRRTQVPEKFWEQVGLQEDAYRDKSGNLKLTLPAS